MVAYHCIRTTDAMVAVGGTNRSTTGPGLAEVTRTRTEGARIVMTGIRPPGTITQSPHLAGNRHPAWSFRPRRLAPTRETGMLAHTLLRLLFLLRLFSFRPATATAVVVMEVPTVGDKVLATEVDRAVAMAVVMLAVAAVEAAATTLLPLHPWHTLNLRPTNRRHRHHTAPTVVRELVLTAAIPMIVKATAGTETHRGSGDGSSCAVLAWNDAEIDR
jgi:hypothetical protein